MMLKKKKNSLVLLLKNQHHQEEWGKVEMVSERVDEQRRLEKELRKSNEPEDGDLVQLAPQHHDLHPDQYQKEEEAEADKENREERPLKR